MSPLDLDVRYIKGIGETRAKRLAKLGIIKLCDLLSYFPRAYEDRTKIKNISDLFPDETACIEAFVSTVPKKSLTRGGIEFIKFRAADNTGIIEITYFNQSYIRDKLEAGKSYIFYGKNTGILGRPSMSNPLFEKTGNSGFSVGRIVPIYRLKTGLSQKFVMGAVRRGLETCPGGLPCALPEYIRQEHMLAQTRFSYENIHFPSDFGALELARRRLAFEELFVLSCALKLLKARRDDGSGLKFPKYNIEEFFSKLPFEPTGAQRRAVSEAIFDMCSGKAMNRLIQGDVGSGKTLVAAALSWYTWMSGFQSAFMVPTEILAGQHLNTLTSLLEPHGMRVDILKGSMTSKRQRLTKSRILTGETDLVIGTHALISPSVEFSRLGLVITDEQHRFGVDQRTKLSNMSSRPHVLVMSATPIPRTLALIIYGDLDISILDELPPGRQRVDTFAVGEDKRARLLAFIEKLAGDGRQIFVVCPMIEDNEGLMPELKSAQSHAQMLEKELPNLRVACIHGKMRQKDQDDLMAGFIAREIDVLVSTTVIEVGVDVPNAALIIVENAERFGLSQLHQLRGRVGRGKHKSYCVLVSSSGTDEATARLKIMQKSSDGFEIAKEDLRLRGPGDFFGRRQHGLPEMRVADIINDIELMKEARQAAHTVMNADPDLRMPENSELLLSIQRLFEINGDIFN